MSQSPLRVENEHWALEGMTEALDWTRCLRTRRKVGSEPWKRREFAIRPIEEIEELGPKWRRG